MVTSSTKNRFCLDVVEQGLDAVKRFLPVTEVYSTGLVLTSPLLASPLKGITHRSGGQGGRRPYTLEEEPEKAVERKPDGFSQPLPAVVCVLKIN